MLTKDTAICIRAIDYSETSQIVTFFTRATGKISAIAKGSKRSKSAFDGPIEILSFGKIVFSNSTKEKLATLTEFEPAPGGPAFTLLSGNFFALNCCLFAAELVNNLTQPYDPHPKLFDSFLQFLESVEEEPRSVETQHRASSIEHRNILSLLILFQLSLLKEVGLIPVLDACVNCKMSFEHRVSSIEHRVYFSSSANGLICRDCEASFPDKVRLTKNAAACLADLKHTAESDEKTLKEIEKILISYFTGLLGRQPKMAKYIARG